MDVAEVGGGTITGDCSLGHAGHGWCVVAAIGDGGVADVMVFGQDHDLGDLRCVLEIAVGDVAGEVVGRH